jgi:hypothetical protein
MGKKFFCEEKDRHSYVCCGTCWNNLSIEGGEDFKETHQFINIIRSQYKKDAIKAGFTEKQAEFLDGFQKDWNQICSKEIFLDDDLS